MRPAPQSWLGRSVARALGAVIVIAIGVTAIRSAAVQLLIGEADDATIGFVRDDPATREIALYRAAKQPLSPAQAQLLADEARRSMRANPLSLNAPFALAAAESALGHKAAARRLFTLAAARNPRNGVVRTWLASDAIARGDLARAVQELDSVLRISPPLVVPVTRAMVPFLQAPNTIDAFTRAAEHNPPWLDAFIDSARRDDRVARPVYRLMLSLSANAPQSVRLGTVEGVVNSALTRGDLASAREIYAAFSPLAHIDRSNLVFDPAFQQAETAAPFAWQIGEVVASPKSSDEPLTFEVERAADGQLMVQQLALSPGRYHLSSQVQPVNLHGDASVTWTVTCANQMTVAALPIPARATAPTWIANDFVIPDGCGAARLALIADRNAAGTLRVLQVAIRVPS